MIIKYKQREKFIEVILTKQLKEKSIGFIFENNNYWYYKPSFNIKLLDKFKLENNLKKSKDELQKLINGMLRFSEFIKWEERKNKLQK